MAKKASVRTAATILVEDGLSQDFRPVITSALGRHFFLTMLAFAAARASRPAARAIAVPLTSVRHRGEHKKGKNEKDQAKAKVFDKLRRLVTMECRTRRQTR